MKNLLALLFIALTSFIVMSDSYEDEVRKRLGLLQNVPIVSMPGMEDAQASASACQGGICVFWDFHILQVSSR